MQRFNQSDSSFNTTFDLFLNQHKNQTETDSKTQSQSLSEQVRLIIGQIQTAGLDSLIELTEKYDHFKINHRDDLILTKQHFQSAFESLPTEEKDALTEASNRIINYHQNQTPDSFQFSDQFGNQLGQLTRPIKRVGIYVPGGSASYPSSVLMNALPAKVAKVSEIVMTVPTPNGEINPLVLAAAHLAGVSQGYRIGGAQAIAALCYGINDFLLPVDKIVGPGNQYVAEAKRQVFGQVGIDMIAGPSELTIVCDQSADPQLICLDLFAQAEHDQLAQAILISPSEDLLKKVEKIIPTELNKQPRKAIIEKALNDNGALIQANDLDHAIDLVNQIAPEHLELCFDSANDYLAKIENAGAIFIGPHSAEVFGDYCAGPSHVLPTSRSARFSSPLGVYDFFKRISLVQCSKNGADQLARISGLIAEKEGLFAHRDSAHKRLKR